jgi:hypothetical protein
VGYVWGRGGVPNATLKSVWRRFMVGEAPRGESNAVVFGGESDRGVFAAPLPNRSERIGNRTSQTHGRLRAEIAPTDEGQVTTRPMKKPF